jgi:hypothetical protein
VVQLKLQPALRQHVPQQSRGTTASSSVTAVPLSVPPRVMFVQVAAASGLAQSLLEACINHHSATAMDVLKMVSSAAMFISTWCSLRVAGAKCSQVHAPSGCLHAAGASIRQRVPVAGPPCCNLLLCLADQQLQGRVPGTTTLVRNYRSHRRLLDLPSKLFYQGSLLAAADPRAGAMAGLVL